MISQHTPAQSVLWSRLDVGEQLLWSGRPRQLPSKPLAYQLLFVFLTIAAFLTYALRNGRYTRIIEAATFPGPFVWFFIAALLFLFTIPLLVAILPYLSNRHTWYGITDRRILIITSLLTTRESSIPLPALAAVTTHKTDTHSLLFTAPNLPQLVFESLEDPQTPHQLIFSIATPPTSR